MTEFGDDEIERYARQIIMPEIGGAGQQRLRDARVTIIGAGGLGSPAAMYLAGAGVGHITLVDDDVVSLSNLHRQILHRTADIGQAKVESGYKAIAALNPYIKIAAENARLGVDNIEVLLRSTNLVIDGSDNSETRYLTADFCAQRHVPLITGSLYRFEGNATVIAPWLGVHGLPGQSPTYRDVFPKSAGSDISPDCAVAGVLGPAAGVIGSVLAVEALKLIVGIGTPLIGRMMHFDAFSARFHTFTTAMRT
ncbi:MAG: molybdopterin-synthase adenylyltransferase MoeB [Pseudomonadota bacterium]